MAYYRTNNSVSLHRWSATMNKVHWSPLLAFTVFFAAAAFPQADAPLTTVPQGTPVTLWMDWKRGSSHYGKDFIELQRPCEGKSCVCVADFKVITSTGNAKEFADYITSFEHGRVPVVYDVVLSEDGRFAGARLLRVGDWTSDKFHRNDGLLGVKVAFKAGSNSGPVGISSPADCFPPRQR